MFINGTIDEMSIFKKIKTTPIIVKPIFISFFLDPKLGFPSLICKNIYLYFQYCIVWELKSLSPEKGSVVSMVSGYFVDSIMFFLGIDWKEVLGCGEDAVACVSSACSHPPGGCSASSRASPYSPVGRATGKRPQESFD